MSDRIVHFLWPAVGTIESAKKASMYGVWAAALSAALTALVAPWAYADAVIFAAVAYGIYKEKRFAAVFGLAFFLIEKADQLADTGKFHHTSVVVTLTLCYIASIRGVYALRKLRKTNDAQQTVPADAAMPRE